MSTIKVIKTDRKTTSFYLDPILVSDFKKAAPIYSNTSPSQLMEDWIRTYLNSIAGKKPEQTFNSTVFKIKRLKLMKTEETLLKRLDNTTCRNKKSAYDNMLDLAEHLGTDYTLTENINDVFKKLQLYEYKGTEPFSQTSLEDFIEYVELVLQHRKIDAELCAFRRKQAASNSAMSTEIEPIDLDNYEDAEEETSSNKEEDFDSNNQFDEA